MSLRTFFIVLAAVWLLCLVLAPHVSGVCLAVILSVLVTLLALVIFYGEN